jgi:Tripartite tricarboxylate transporter family receptor
VDPGVCLGLANSNPPLSWAELARATPDGYTVGGGTISSHGIHATLYGKLPFEAVTSFVPGTL